MKINIMEHYGATKDLYIWGRGARTSMFNFATKTLEKQTPN